MAGDFYYCIDSQQYGPCSPEHLKGLIASGQLTRDVLVWKEGLADWMHAANVPGLYPPAMRPSPPIDAWATMTQPAPITAAQYWPAAGHSLQRAAPSRGRQTHKGLIAGIVAVAVIAVIGFMVLNSNSSSNFGIGGTGGDEKSAKEHFLSVAKNMGEEPAAQQVIRIVDKRYAANERVNWSGIDQDMLGFGCTPETMVAYYAWRNAEIAAHSK